MGNYSTLRTARALPRRKPRFGARVGSQRLRIGLPRSVFPEPGNGVYDIWKVPHLYQYPMKEEVIALWRTESFDADRNIHQLTFQ